jgi:outer membrane protein TolC
LALLPAVLAGPVAAQTPEFPPPPALPPMEQAIRALRESPRVQIAVEYAASGEALRDSLRAGPHEWEIETHSQQRRDELGANHFETGYSLQTGLRWPWKYSLDQRRGELALQAGELAYLDAWHEASRDLLDLWLDWTRAEQLVQLVNAQSATVRSQRDAVARRVDAGDAAALELQLADAEASRLQASRGTALREAMLAREALAREFPDLTAVPPTTLPPPPQLPGRDDLWTERISTHNHEVELAGTLRDEAQLTAERASRDRLADPTVALHYSENFGGDRRVIGLSVRLPIGGARRSAEAALARSAARSAEGELMQATSNVGANARLVVADARRSHDIWLDQQAAATAQQAAADTAARGYSLGEFDINQMLAARRSALDAERELLESLIRAQRSYARVLLDAHLLWNPPDHESHGD